MYLGEDSFEPQEVSADIFPLIINGDAETLLSVISIKRIRSTHGRIDPRISGLPYDKPFLHIFNAGIHADFRSYAQTANIRLVHEFARDIEGDVTRIVSVDLENIIPLNLFGGSATYTAFLTGMNIYAEESKSPFATAVKQDDSEEYNANYGYPYLPPVTHIKANPFPFKVEVDVSHLSHSDLTEWRNSLIS